MPKTLLVLIAIGATFLQPATRAAQGEGVLVPESVRAAAVENGTARIIVGVRASFRGEGRLSAPAVAAQRAGIAGVVNRVIESASLPARARIRRLSTIPFFAAEVDLAALDALARHPDVVSIQEDAAWRVQPTADLSAPAAAGDSVRAIGAPAAWAKGFTGTGWTVAVIGAGVDGTHPLLAGKIVSEACYSHSFTTNTSYVSALCPGGAASSTAPGSGAACTLAGCSTSTHAAGIIAGNGSDFSGVAPDATLIAIQVYSKICFWDFAHTSCSPDGLYTATSAWLAALDRVVELKDTHRVAAVYLEPVGYATYANALACQNGYGWLGDLAALENIWSAGIAVIAPAGESSNPTELPRPACSPYAVSVGSTDNAGLSSEVVSAASNAAPFLSLLAPGSNITSTIPGGTLGELSGTAPAAAHVAGAWAVLKGRKPGATIEELRSTLRATGLPIADPRSTLLYPRIRLDAAVTALTRTEVALDSPVDGARVSDSFMVQGWAIDPSASSGTGVDAVHVWAYPSPGSGLAPWFLGAASYGTIRTDIGNVYGDRFAASGFALEVVGLPLGRYQVVAFARSTVADTFDASRGAVVTYTSEPQAAIDLPAGGTLPAGPFVVSGWAIDGAAVSDSGVDAVHIYVYPAAGGEPVFIGGATYGIQRDDVAAVFGANFRDSGYWLPAPTLASGDYRLVVYYRSRRSGRFASVSRAISVVGTAAPDPRMAIDIPADGSEGPIHRIPIAGWAIDRGATDGTGVDAVHVWAFPVTGGAPIFLGAAPYGGARPDVAALYGARLINCGYNTAALLPTGAYDIVVYARSTVTGTFNQARVARVAINP